jgi:hypothetical protein
MCAATFRSLPCTPEAITLGAWRYSLVSIAQFCCRDTYEWPTTIASEDDLSRYVSGAMNLEIHPSRSLDDILMPMTSVPQRRVCAVHMRHIGRSCSDSCVSSVERTSSDKAPFPQDDPDIVHFLVRSPNFSVRDPNVGARSKAGGNDQYMSIYLAYASRATAPLAGIRSLRKRLCFLSSCETVRRHFRQRELEGQHRCRQL